MSIREFRHESRCGICKLQGSRQKVSRPNDPLAVTCLRPIDCCARGRRSVVARASSVIVIANGGASPDSGPPPTHSTGPGGRQRSTEAPRQPVQLALGWPARARPASCPSRESTVLCVRACVCNNKNSSLLRWPFCCCCCCCRRVCLTNSSLRLCFNSGCLLPLLLLPV